MAQHSSWIPARVALDGHTGPYDAEILADQRYNGGVIPRFTRQVAEQVAADVTAANTGPHVYPLNALVVRFDGDQVLIIEAPGTAEEEVLERVEPDPDGRYRIGAYRWRWSRVDTTPVRHRLYTLTVQFLGDDDPDRAAADAYPAVAALDLLVGVYQAELGYDTPDGVAGTVEVTCARDVPAEGICLRRPGHHGRCTRTSDPSTPSRNGESS